MNLEKYGITSDSDRLTFEFLSSGPNGTIKKVVLYQEIASDVYNLAIGDWNEQKQRVDDNARSNNEDREKVLATVASTVIEFINITQMLPYLPRETHRPKQDFIKWELRLIFEKLPR